MTKRLCLPGVTSRIEECTQCGASSGSYETLGESMALRLAHVLQIFWLFPFPFPFPFPRFRVFQLPFKMCINFGAVKVLHSKSGDKRESSLILIKADAD